MLLEIVKVVLPYLYFVTLTHFLQVVILKNSYLSEKEYYHSLHKELTEMFNKKVENK